MTSLSKTLAFSHPSSVWSHLQDKATKLARAFTHRREVARLAQMDERFLDDIGVSKADLERALHSPLNEDPSLHLRRSRIHHKN